MPAIDLTRFGFTPTESLVYQVLLTAGPGTGYAIARGAGLARANAYSALEGLVSKGAARVEGTRPRRYRPEAPALAYPLLAPALRRPYSAGLPLGLMATGPVELEFAPVEVVAAEGRWPGMPVILVVDDRSAIHAARNGSDVRGHWSTAPSFVAGARLALERFRTP